MSYRSISERLTEQTTKKIERRLFGDSVLDAALSHTTTYSRETREAHLDRLCILYAAIIGTMDHSHSELETSEAVERRARDVDRMARIYLARLER